MEDVNQQAIEYYAHIFANIIQGLDEADQHLVRPPTPLAFWEGFTRSLLEIIARPPPYDNPLIRHTHSIRYIALAFKVAEVVHEQTSRPRATVRLITDSSNTGRSGSRFVVEQYLDDVIIRRHENSVSDSLSRGQQQGWSNHLDRRLYYGELRESQQDDGGEGEVVD